MGGILPDSAGGVNYYVAASSCAIRAFSMAISHARAGLGAEALNPLELIGGDI